MSKKRFKKEGVDSLDKKVEKKEQDREDYDAFGFLKNKKQTAAVAGVFFLFGFLVSWFTAPSMTGLVIENSLPTNTDELGNTGVDFLNKYFVDGGGVTLKSTEDDGELIKLTTEYQGNEIPVHMTKDGRFIILGGIGAIDMAEYAEQMNSQEPQDTQDETPQSPPATADVPKSDRPVANVFIMSYCPYGLQMQKALIPSMELLGDKADINVNFVHYIMHGEKEIIDNNNQYCIQRDQADRYVDYLKCFVEKGDHATCADGAGVDTAKLDSCIAEIDEQFNITGLYEDKSTWSKDSQGNPKFPTYMVNADIANQFGVRGSPTFVLNGQIISVQRSPEAVKQAICNSFTDPPEECSQTLSAAAEATSFGPLGQGSASADSSASCG